MKRQTTIIIAVVALLAIGVGGWFAYTRFAAPDRSLLVGRWEGTGQSKSVMTIGNEMLPTQFTHNSRVEFRSDGTYTLELKSSAGGDGAGIKLSLTFPKEGQPAPSWELVRKDGRTYLKWHMDEVEIEFQGKDSFTLKWSKPDDEGSETFRRVP